VNNKDIGGAGEAAAATYIENLGYKVIDTNVRPFSDKRRGEIDIVAWHGDVLCIIEVKTRVSHVFDATEAITIGKRRQLTKLAKAYISKYRLDSTECRFDVICVYNRAGQSEPYIELRAGAFDPCH
jgi:putative endonuclease